AAPNSAFAERDLDARLRGYDDVSELTALWDHRHEPWHPFVRALIGKPGDARITRAPAMVLRSGAAPWPPLDRPRKGLDEAAGRPDLPLLDRVRYGQYPPGSTFTPVPAPAGPRAANGVAERPFDCRPLPDGRVGIQLDGWRRPVRDDATDRAPHGDVTLDEGLRVSCNAYFAQLGLAVGPRALKET